METKEGRHHSSLFSFWARQGVADCDHNAPRRHSFACRSPWLFECLRVKPDLKTMISWCQHTAIRSLALIPLRFGVPLAPLALVAGCVFGRSPGRPMVLSAQQLLKPWAERSIWKAWGMLLTVMTAQWWHFFKDLYNCLPHFFFQGLWRLCPILGARWTTPGCRWSLWRSEGAKNVEVVNAWVKRASLGLRWCSLLFH